MPTKIGNGGHSQENYDPETGKYVKSSMGDNSDIKEAISIDWNSIESIFTDVNWDDDDEEITTNNENYLDEIREILNKKVIIQGAARKSDVNRLFEEISKGSQECIQRIYMLLKSNYFNNIIINGRKQAYFDVMENSVYLGKTYVDCNTIYHELGHALDYYRNDILNPETSKGADTIINIKRARDDEKYKRLDSFIEDFVKTTQLPDTINKYYEYKKMDSFDPFNPSISNFSDSVKEMNKIMNDKKMTDIFKGISDFMSYLTNNKVNLRYGHKNYYWTEDRNNGITEFFANMHASKAQGRDDIIECFRRHYPELVEIFDSSCANIDKKLKEEN